MFWGDIAVEMPQILGLLPDNVTLLNWLYAPGIGEDKVRLVAQAGAPQYVCSAVWCWNALLPRLDDSWNNISRLARYGVKYGAVGYLVTDWGDYGHVNDPRMAVSGMIFGAQCAWNPMAHIQGEAGCGDGEEGSAAGYADAAADEEHVAALGALVGEPVAIGPAQAHFVAHRQLVQVVGGEAHVLHDELAVVLSHAGHGEHALAVGRVAEHAQLAGLASEGPFAV